MKYRILSFDKEARDKLARGADILTQAVVSTLGPRSRNVAINPINPSPYNPPIVLHDGVSIAKQIKLKDPFEDMGAALIREAASKTNDLAGDGTTTATLLANTLLQGGLKLIESGIDEGIVRPGLNPMELKEQFDEISKKIVEKLDKMAVEVTDEMLDSIATIASTSPESGKLVAKAVRKVGRDGLVMVEESEDFETKIEYKEGMEWDNGYLHRGFATNLRMETDYQDAYVLVTDMTISDANVLVPILTKVIKEGKALLIVANDVVGAAMQALLATKFRPETQAKVVAVMAPDYADRRLEAMEDIAILTGGTVISIEKGMDLEATRLGDLGRASSILVNQTHTKVVPANPDTEEIQERIESIKQQIEEEENPVRKASLETRLARLGTGTAVIKVGGATKVEIGDKRERIIDAIHAVKAAITEGVIPGGGVALRSIAEGIIDKGDSYDLVQEALWEPFKKLLENSGIKLKDGDKFNSNDGIDVKTGEWVNMIEAGIIDPVKVTKLAVQHAFSVAGMILTTNCLITEEEDDSIQKIRVVNREAQ